MRRLPPDHRGEERALPAVLAAGRGHRRRPAQAHRGGLPARRRPAAVVRRDEPARQHRPAARRPCTRALAAARPARRDPAGTARPRGVPPFRQGSLGRIQHYRPGLAADPAHRRRARRDPRLEPADRHRDRPGAGRHPGQPSGRGPDRLVSAATRPAPPGPERHPDRRDPPARRAAARRPDPLLHVLDAGAARGPAGADGRRRGALAAHPQRRRPPQPGPATSTPSG